MLRAMIHRVRDVAVAFWAATMRAIHWAGGHRRSPQQKNVGHSGRDLILDALTTSASVMSDGTYQGAALVLEIDNFEQLEKTINRDGQEDLFFAVSNVIADVLGRDDVFARLEGPRFGMALSSAGGFDLEQAIQLATRIQHALAEPLNLSVERATITVSIGFALASRVETNGPAALFHSACIAQIEASRAGPAAIRSFSPAMQRRIDDRGELAQELDAAFQRGDIIAYFQPQLCLRDDMLAGFEALARWQHPTRGMISPAEFLPILMKTGQMGRLGHKMLCDALRALSQWDAMGLNVPQVSVNLSKVELRNPAFVDQIMHELDRFDLAPTRLVIEVLETVVATGVDDLIVANLHRLAALGCRIDLDDFGTGHASITAIRQFSVHRIKIDRSFITNIDKDEEQRSMVDAILTMAERLGLDTLAEGVETPQEQATLVELGCDHMQGFVLARPMPPAQAGEWAARWMGMAGASNLVSFK